MREWMFVRIPLDGQFVSAPVNELGVRQNLNYLSRWCCESKQEIFTLKLNDRAFYSYPMLLTCGLHVHLKYLY